jgi:hypothetical protein
MKKVIMTLVIAVSSIGAFANEGDVNQDVLNAFNKEFTGAKEVIWTANTGYYHAAFVFNQQYISAFYNTDGSLIALTRNISSLELPLNLQAKLRNNYSGYWISALTEVSKEEGPSYYVTLESADSRITMKSSANKRWTIVKKTIKA